MSLGKITEKIPKKNKIMLHVHGKLYSLLKNKRHLRRHFRC